MLAGVVECPAQGGAAEGSRCVSWNQRSPLRDPEGEGLFPITKLNVWPLSQGTSQSNLTSKSHATLPLLGLPVYHSFSKDQALCPDLSSSHTPPPPTPASKAQNGADIPGKSVD